MKKSLWTKNFTIMFMGSILSALGGIGLNVALGVVIFDNTQSTFLSSLYIALTSIPTLVLPLFLGSVVDRNNPLKVLLKNETILLLVFMMALFYVTNFDFHYIVYLVFGLVIAALGVLSELSSQSISAQLMPEELMSRGYAILSTIYPMCNVLVTPIALFLYKTYGIQSIFIAYIITSTIDLLMESRINFDFEFNESVEENNIILDIKEGLRYLNTKKEIKTTFIFFTFVMIANGYSTLVYPYFSNHATLSLENYALIMSVNSLGYMFGGFFHYFVEIPKKYRYGFAIFFYSLFIIFDSVFLFLPLSLMLLTRFILGFAGMNSANIRNNAVQASISNDNRGKVNGIFSMMMGFSNIIGSLLFGLLAEFISIPNAVIIAQGIYLLACFIFIIPKKNNIKQLYNLELIKNK